jgi:hypothetical protein
MGRRPHKLSAAIEVVGHHKRPHELSAAGRNASVGGPG